ncbi:MAG TPA: Sec-independent protein translocase protein TatB [Candidatus Sulfotelmatobacter sp.]|nr:Sec-independent protein translocase protein TatB [Candidatus Sulfotelmatobacter sp.]
MFDIAWSEMAIIAAVALVVIGPKDLPRVLRTVGQWTGRARAMAREFQNSLEELAREAELEALKKDVEKVVTTDVASAIDPGGELKQSIQEVQSATQLDPALEPPPATGIAPPVPGIAPPASAETIAAAPAPVPEPQHEPLPRTGTGAPV